MRSSGQELAGHSPRVGDWTRRRWRSARCLLVVAPSVLLFAFATGGVVHAQEVDDEARRIAQGLQCPVCQGLSVADSPAELATQMRGVIREKLQAGASHEEILNYFVDRYGESVLLAPPLSGFTALAWIAPYGAVLAGVGILVLILRGRPSPQRTDSPPDPTLDLYYREVDETFEVLRDETLR